MPNWPNADIYEGQTGALSGLKVVDISRILAGPTCTQLLGDMGADVIKIENPKSGGDDTRGWGPPFVQDAEGKDSDLSAYFVCANRNKRSVSADISTPEGQTFVRDLIENADVVIENFKPGGLEKYGLDADTITAAFPHIIYCSISGFGKTGPNSHLPGYDLMAQGYGGIMSLTGEPDGQPMKVAVGIADVMCGMYASTGILAALRHRDQTGLGQHVEIALVDAQIAWLINEGTNYLISKKTPVRRGNSHPNIAPYQVYATADGHVIVAVGNDSQFQRFCEALQLGPYFEDGRFSTNSARLIHRDELNEIIEPRLAELDHDEVIQRLKAAGVPVGPVNTLDKVFESDQVLARDMKISLPNADGTEIPMIGNPLKFSRTPVLYNRPPPTCGQHDEEVRDAMYMPAKSPLITK